MKVFIYNRGLPTIATTAVELSFWDVVKLLFGYELFHPTDPRVVIRLLPAYVAFNLLAK